MNDLRPVKEKDAKKFDARCQYSKKFAEYRLGRSNFPWRANYLYAILFRFICLHAAARNTIDNRFPPQLLQSRCDLCKVTFGSTDIERADDTKYFSRRHEVNSLFYRVFRVAVLTNITEILRYAPLAKKLGGDKIHFDSWSLDPAAASKSELAPAALRSCGLRYELEGGSPNDLSQWRIAPVSPEF